MPKPAAMLFGLTPLPLVTGSTVLLAAVMTLLCGCDPLTLGMAAGSQAAMLGAASWGDMGVGYRSVQQNFPTERGVDVALFPYNWNAVRDPKYFSVAVEFSNDPTSPLSIDADFRRFTLSMPNGSVVRPIGYAPAYPGTISQGCRNGSGANSLPSAAPRTVYDIHPFPESPIRVRSQPWSRLSECFDLIFPVATLAPDSVFSINVAGVSIGGSPMRGERVLFARGPGR